jgi:hypothetical protein
MKAEPLTDGEAVEWYTAEIIDQRAPRLRQTTEGPPKVVAAWLRAVADQMDPPKRPTRTLAETMRGLTETKETTTQ